MSSNVNRAWSTGTATPETGVTYLAITGNEPTEWLEPVPEEEFNSIEIPNTNSTSAGQELIDLSEEKWQWMADKDVEKLSKKHLNMKTFIGILISISIISFDLQAQNNTESDR